MPSHRALADRIVDIWSHAVEKETLPVIQLCGDDVSSKRAIAMTTCALLGLSLNVMAAHFIPVGPSELEGLICLWGREAILSSSALLMECDEIDDTDQTRERAITRFIEDRSCPLILATRERRRERQRTLITFDVPKPTANEQRAIWYSVLGGKA